MIFNSPLEIGLRALIILTESSPVKLDLQSLIYYDYFVLYPEDSPLKVELISNHPKSPYRSGELIIKREILNKGLLLMIKKGLISVEYHNDGIFYSSTELSAPFLGYFESDYSKEIIDTSKLVIKGLNQIPIKQLEYFVNSHINIWGTEYTYEAILREGNNDQ